MVIRWKLAKVTLKITNTDTTAAIYRVIEVGMH